MITSLHEVFSSATNKQTIERDHNGGYFATKDVADVIAPNDRKTKRGENPLSLYIYYSSEPEEESSPSKRDEDDTVSPYIYYSPEPEETYTPSKRGESAMIPYRYYYPEPEEKNSPSTQT